MSKYAMQIGAGNIGRGLNGYILNKNGYQIIFVDNDQHVVNLLNQANDYQIIYLDQNKQKSDTITNFQALNLQQQYQDVVNQASQCELILISIGLDNLVKLADFFCDCISKHYQSKQTQKINIVAVENGLNASQHLQTCIARVLKEPLQKYWLKYFYFSNCAVDRIVPNQEQTNLDVKVELFYELVIDQNQWNGPLLKNVNYSTTLQKYLQRKLFMLNAVHSFIAWSGLKYNFQYIYQFQENFQLVKQVHELLDEFQAILQHQYDFSLQQLQEYHQQIFQRLTNQAIKDDVIRVSRGIKRKLAANDRLVTPLRYAVEHQIKHLQIIKAIALAFSNLKAVDDDIAALNQYIKQHSLAQAIQYYCQISDPKLIEMIIHEIPKI